MVLHSKNLPLFIVDGKEASKKEMDQINSSTIESINVLKSKSAVDKYGQRGKNGVLEVRLKKQKSSSIITSLIIPGKATPGKVEA